MIDDDGVVRALLDQLGVVVTGDRPHPRTGRHVLHLVDTDDGRMLLIKRGVAEHIGREAAAGAVLRQFDFVRSPLAVSPCRRVAIYEYHREAEDLEAIARRNLDLALALLLELGIRMIALQSLTPALEPVPAFVDFPVPHYRQVQDASPGLIATLQEAQSRDLLRRAAPGEPLPLRFAHGDMKLDNILSVDGGALLIDCELCSLAPAGTDIAACAALMLAAAVHFESFTGAPEPEGRSLRRAMSHAGALAIIFRGQAGDGAAASAPVFDRMIARALLDRAFKESGNRFDMAPSDGVLIDLADMVLTHGIDAADQGAQRAYQAA